MSSTVSAQAPRSGNHLTAPNETDLFAQQLQMYATLGRKEQNKAATAKARSEAEFMSLLSAYFSGTDPKDYRTFLPKSAPQNHSAPSSFEPRKQYTSPQTKPIDVPPVMNPRIISMAASAFKPAPSSSPPNNHAKNYRIDVPATTYTDYRRSSIGTGSALSSPHAPEDEIDYEHRSSVSSVDDNNSHQDSASPASVKWNSESGFDVVFQQQSMGMKLGYDPVRKCAVVKECFEGTESKKYKQITNGVAIMSVNGQTLCGISLSKIMSRLREAQRPAVIRFETESP